MVQQITKGIKISVETSFEGTFYKNYKMQYAFHYMITIENQSKETVQLVARHWIIRDALSTVETVSGEGVVGFKPILKPGETHAYTSGCMLTAPFGSMQGHYNMINLNNSKKFKVIIPTFHLNADFAIN
ncbi:ApaG domain-containing protein [Formosa agariphila KMM 3901]|uniref:ApaG domain-containing protein n=1 Tax=Formosa agariphila (strain DSM 15362 / KCTC 12365 / LMG 23005 / KMM 3901 / M-2Alg 35-1) TaxID=1347342 RepID=T2KH79_FORAG|nr:Co2+/Mg2+ efflux protein ApaG [Formosa agariphila]CDF78202.1 ApaG domain-containing protein [Formosa agariphila KMM 3901]